MPLEYELIRLFEMSVICMIDLNQMASYQCQFQHRGCYHEALAVHLLRRMNHRMRGFGCAD
jgi:hypothetical protein